MQISIVDKHNLDDAMLRIDAEYYRPDILFLEEKIKTFNSKSIRQLKGELDCSAFYPSITQYYDFAGKGIPFLRVNEISNGLVVITENTAFLPQSVLLDNPTTISHAQPGDIIIAKGGNSLAKVGLVTEQYNDYAFCRDLIVLRTSKIKEVNRYYLWVFLHSNVGQNLLIRTASQTGQPHLTLESIYRLKIPLFSQSLRDQFEILYLEAVELANDSHKYYYEAEKILLSELDLLNWKPKHRQSFIKNFSHTKSAIRFDAEYFQPMYEEIYRKIKKYKSGYKLLGKGDDAIVSIKKCIEPGSEVYQDSGIPFLRVSNLSKFEIKTYNQQFISEAVYDSLKTHQPKKGEILLSKDATPGIAYYLKDSPCKMIPSGGILRLTINNPKSIYPEYLTLVLNSVIVQKQIERDSGGSIINHWLVEQVMNTLIPILPLSVQKRIFEKIVKSFSNREQSKRILEIAKRSVELAIEKNETEALKWAKSEMVRIHA